MENHKIPYAFPTQNDERYFHGMNLLDYFAGKAMREMGWNASSVEIENGDAYRWQAEKAYRIALAMLKEREKHL